MAQDPNDANLAEIAAENADIVNAGPADDELCGECGEKIKEESGSYNAKYHDGRWYHNNGNCIRDLICIECEKVIDTTKGYIPTGPYHTDCYYEKLGSCAGCDQKFDKAETPVKDIRSTSKLGNWHRDCFKCTKCDKIIEENEYSLIDGKQVHSSCA